MTREERIKSLLVSVLETIADATESMEIESADCGILHFPILKYNPTFEFTDEDILLIQSLGEEEMMDFSMLTES